MVQRQRRQRRGKMPGKRSSKPAPKYFVPVSRKVAPESPAKSVTGAKYFVRSFPLPAELPEVWDGTGPDLPPGYESRVDNPTGVRYGGAEACPDCSAFRGSKHAPLCIRNPAQQTFDMAAAWEPLHTKEQIFFGAGHPIQTDVDHYMTQEKQRRLARLGIVVLYDIPQGSSFHVLDDAHFEKRQVIAHWRERRR